MLPGTTMQADMVFVMILGLPHIQPDDRVMLQTKVVRALQKGLPSGWPRGPVCAVPDLLGEEHNTDPCQGVIIMISNAPSTLLRASLEPDFLKIRDWLAEKLGRSVEIVINPPPERRKKL